MAPQQFHPKLPRQDLRGQSPRVPRRVLSLLQLRAAMRHPLLPGGVPSGREHAQRRAAEVGFRAAREA